MKTILYATDYSENSELALRYAHHMSVKMEAKLMIIHVFDYPTLLDEISLKPEAAFPDLEGDAYKKHNAKLKAFYERVLKGAVATSTIEIDAIENSSAVQGIILKAKEIDALLIVTGMKCYSVLKELIMGSAAKHLIENAPCALLTIPHDSVNIKIQNILYATDFEEEDFGALNKLIEIAEPFNAKIKIVHVSPLDETFGKIQQRELEEKIHKHINYSNLELDILYADDAFHALKMHFGQSNADVIAMLERNSSVGAEKVFHRDLVKRMESYGKIPVMIFNAKNYGAFHVS